MTKLEAILEQFNQALSRLDEVLKEEKSSVVRDSAIKRFEIVFDLCWKALKTYLEERVGVVCRSPKECFRHAYQQKLIDYDEYWLMLTDIRNDIAHTYNEKFADEVYKKLPEAFSYFQKLLAALKSENSHVGN